MKKFILFLFTATTLCLTSFSQYWQQEVNYIIDVTLNDNEHTLDGFEKIEYTNNSPDTLRFIWFHLWPNAYKNDKTAFSDQLLVNGNTKFYFSDKEQKGYINRLDFKVNNITAAVEDHPNHIDIAKVVLPEAMPPGQTVTITTPFHVKLPYNFSRGGHDGQSYQATQWYPKPAVYDREGWHPMPYLDQGEFYSEFGNFTVAITVPKNYVVAATGELQNPLEKEWLKTRTSFEWKPVTKKEKLKGGGIKTTLILYPPSDKETKTLQFKQDKIHDFAWFADKRFIVDYDSCKIGPGKIVDVYSYYTILHKERWKNSIQYAKDGIRHYSAFVGEYPYNVLSVVQGPESFGGGMEYPTITIITPTRKAETLEQVIVHEIGHNWFYGILGTNERKHPWMDEGINSYYERQYSRRKDPNHSLDGPQALLETIVTNKTDQAIATSSEDFSELNYGLIAYLKASRWVDWIESYVGVDTFHNAMRGYYRQWKFKHPRPSDLKSVLEQTSKKNLDSAFTLLNQKGPLPGWQRKGTVFQTPFGRSFGFERNKKTVITLLPAIGFNSYDKLMIGAHISNLKLPPNRLQFLFSPMYATGSKTFAGLGFVNLSFFPDGIFRKIDLGVSAATFSADRFTADDGSKYFPSFRKIVPGIKATFREKDPRNSFYRFIRFKSFLVTEDDLRFYRDTIINGLDTLVVDKYRTTGESRTLNQLQLVIENNRVLYPYRGELKIEQGKHFVRTAFTGNYFFNYQKEGGLNVRLFAGKFIYTSTKTISKQFATDRYHLNMTGANGYEDYTYSDYFIGRNKFEGLASQQIMLRDGGFKVRTDLLAEKVGRTDDWLIAANFTTTIPSGLNPLSVLPMKIPLKLFIDVGTQAKAWEHDAEEDRFIYDAGLQVSLLKETVHIYLPLLYSKVFKDYIQSTIAKKGRLWKTVSFTIDVSNFSARKFDRRLNF